MKFTILSDELREQLQMVGRVISGKSLAIMEFALFEIKGDKLSLTATDGETRIRVKMDLPEKEGDDISFCVRVKQLLEPVREIPNQMIRFELDTDKYELNGKYNNGFFAFPVVSGDDFPEVSPLDGSKLELKMPLPNFIEGLENTLYATSMDDVRPIMTGVHMDIRPDNITFVGTNGFLLSYYRHSLLELDLEEPYKVTLQRKPAQLLAQVLSKSDEVMEMEFYGNYAKFRTERIELLCRLLEGKYPNYETVIPKENDKILEADRLQLLAATRRVAVFANKGMDLVSFEFAPTQLTLKSSDVDFSTNAEEVVPVSFSDTEARFSFRSEHLIQILSVLPSQNIVMKIGDAARAALISPVEVEAGVEIVVAVMPFVYS